MQIAKPLCAFALIFAYSISPCAEWTYSNGKSGPQHWGGDCQTGKEQSPVDIEDGKVTRAQLPAISFDYRPTPLSSWNNGHTVQVNWEAGSSISLGDDRYWLLQVHFHTPSEEKINGKSFDMVAHFVHKNDDGNLAVVAVLFKQGAPNPELNEIFTHIPAAGKRDERDETVDPVALLPNDRAYYTLPGSLTTPPCSEGVRWLILKHTMTLSRQQLAMLRKYFPENARPVQSLNARTIQMSE